MARNRIPAEFRIAVQDWCDAAVESANAVCNECGSVIDGFKMICHCSECGGKRVGLEVRSLWDSYRMGKCRWIKEIIK